MDALCECNAMPGDEYARVFKLRPRIRPRYRPQIRRDRRGRHRCAECNDRGFVRDGRFRIDRFARQAIAWNLRIVRLHRAIRLKRQSIDNVDRPAFIGLFNPGNGMLLRAYVRFEMD